MSTAPASPISPFKPETTPTIDRANRLISLRNNPGFLDMVRISQDLVNEVSRTANTYPGWDRDELFTLHMRAKAAIEHHEALLARINEAINRGVDEARASLESLPQKTVAEVIDQGDYVRQEILTKFNDMDTRSAGSF